MPKRLSISDLTSHLSSISKRQSFLAGVPPAVRAAPVRLWPVLTFSNEIRIGIRSETFFPLQLAPRLRSTILVQLPRWIQFCLLRTHGKFVRDPLNRHLRDGIGLGRISYVVEAKSATLAMSVLRDCEFLTLIFGTEGAACALGTFFGRFMLQ